MKRERAKAVNVRMSCHDAGPCCYKALVAVAQKRQREALLLRATVDPAIGLFVVYVAACKVGGYHQR